MFDTLYLYALSAQRESRSLRVSIALTPKSSQYALLLKEFFLQ